MRPGGRLPRVQVGIVSYNSLADLPGCFAALQAQIYPALQVSVLDNASSDGSPQWVARHQPQALLLRNDRNVGFAQGHNALLAALSLGQDDYYMPLNPDVRLRPDYIARLLIRLDVQGAGWGTGKLLADTGLDEGLPVIYSVGHALRRDGYALNIGHGLPDQGQFDRSREIFGAPGAAPLIRKALIDDLAGELYEPAMFLYNEDVDFDWRARRQGWRCWYEPRAVAYHRGSQAAGSLRTQALGNRYLAVVKNAALIDLLSYNLPLMLAHCLARILVSPPEGLRLLRQLCCDGPALWRKRRPARQPRRSLQSWFLWSAMQPTDQPLTWRERWRSFQQIRQQERAETSSAVLPAPGAQHLP